MISVYRSPNQVQLRTLRVAFGGLWWPLVAARGAREGLWLEQKQWERSVSFEPRAGRVSPRQVRVSLTIKSSIITALQHKQFAGLHALFSSLCSTLLKVLSNINHACVPLYSDN